MKKILILILLAFCKISLANNIKVGNEQIFIPTPNGFGKCTPEMRELNKIVEKFIPQSNKLLALFIIEDQIELALNNEIPSLERYIMIHSSKPIEEKIIDSEYFDKLKKINKELLIKKSDEIHQKSVTHIEKSFDDISNTYSVDAKIKYNEPVIFPVHHETRNKKHNIIINIV